MPSFILPRHYCLDLAAYPPALPACSGHRTGRSYCWFMWHYSMQGLPSLTITCPGRRLLPCVFTLIPPGSGTVIFCGTICIRLGGPRLLTGALPCAVRTFLPLCVSKERDGPVGSKYKGTISLPDEAFNGNMPAPCVPGPWSDEICV